MNASLSSVVRLIVVFLVSFSLLSLSGPLSSGLQFPNLHLLSSLPPCITINAQGACSDFWYPSGPAMDTLLNPIFVDQQAEFANIQTGSPQIDMTDLPLTPDLIAAFTSSPNLYISNQISQTGYFDIQFMLANNFWGCDFNFGNSQCGIEIRQGISHLIDKAKFVSDEPSIKGLAVAIDNPVPPINGGLPSANPCAWDAAFPQSGSRCIVGSPGGTSYHLQNATGANGHSWLPAPGSPDLCAAAQHFINAGIATSKDANCILSGFSSTAAAHNPTVYIRSDDPPRLHFGDSIIEQICYLLTGAYIAPCGSPTQPGIRSSLALGAFPGLTTSTNSVNLSWWMYTGAYLDSYPFDASLYHTYNSQFVSGISSIRNPSGNCNSQSVPSPAAANYMYMCNPNYDNLSSQMEYAPCPSAAGDPSPGQVPNGPGANCPGTIQLSAISAGVQSEDAYGKGAYSIPVFTITNAQYVYLKNWDRVPNGDGTGIPNFFTWLNTYNANPAVPGTVRQGFSQNTRSTNPYIAETPHDFYIVRNIYDSLMVQNPLNKAQLINWMAVNQQQLTSLTYTPPPGTVTTYRFTLRNDLFFQDGRRVTTFDAAFTYLSMLANGAFQSIGISEVSGITLLGPLQFDINMRTVGPFTLQSLTSLTIIPGHYWTSAGGSAWDSSIQACTGMGSPCFPAQYTLGPTPADGPPPIACNNGPGFSCVFPASNMNVDPAKISASYDPIANHILVGSGPWQCGSGATLGGGVGGCTDTGVQNPGVSHSYTLTRFGKGVFPGAGLSNTYFRSSGTLALCIWANSCNGDLTRGFLDMGIASACYGKPVGTPGCVHWQRGIGNPNGDGVTCCVVGISQVGIMSRWVGVGWITPYNWASGPPTGIGSFPPVLYEGSVTLNPASIAGCAGTFPTSGYDC